MKRYNLFLDFDDTISPTKNLITCYFNNKYNLNCREEDFQDNDNFEKAIVEKGYDISSDELYLDFGENFFPCFINSDQIRLFDGAKEAIKEFSNIYNLYIVTSRQKKEEKYIRQIIEKNDLSKCISGIHCVWDFRNGSFQEEPKLQFMQTRSGTNVGFIDDSIKEIHKASPLINSVLFDPKKKHSASRSYETVSSWADLRRIFT